jgi:hypothetical protein
MWFLRGAPLCHVRLPYCFVQGEKNPHRHEPSSASALDRRVRSTLQCCIRSLPFGVKTIWWPIRRARQGTSPATPARHQRAGVPGPGECYTCERRRELRWRSVLGPQPRLIRWRGVARPCFVASVTSRHWRAGPGRAAPRLCSQEPSLKAASFTSSRAKSSPDNLTLQAS